MENTKLFVVIAVLLLIFSGIIAYLVVIDRRLKKLENKMSQNPD